MISAKFAHDFEKLSRTRVLLINKVDAHGVAPFNMRLRPVSIERSKKKRALPCTYEIHAHSRRAVETLPMESVYPTCLNSTTCLVQIKTARNPRNSTLRNERHPKDTPWRPNGEWRGGVPGENAQTFLRNARRLPSWRLEQAIIIQEVPRSPTYIEKSHIF